MEKMQFDDFGQSCTVPSDAEETTPLFQQLSPALYPPFKEDELLILLSHFEVETEYADPDIYDEAVTMRIKNPHGGFDLDLYLEDNFAIGFAGFSGWFDANEDGYLQFLSTVIGLLSGQIGVLLVGEELPYCLLWESAFPQSEAQLIPHGIEMPSDGIYLSLEFFDPSKKRSDYLLKEKSQ